MEIFEAFLENEVVVSVAVLLQGGTGNQLFQWAYSHYLAHKGLEVDLVFPLKSYLLPHTSLPLSNLLDSCEHVKFTEKKLPKNRAARLLCDPSNPRFIFKPLQRVLHDTTKQPYAIPNNFKESNTKYHLGYYQNWNFPFEFRNQLRNEIWNALPSQKSSTLEKELAGVEVVHVRQGDTTSAQNISTIGVLSELYYDKLPPKGDAIRVVITDDIEGSHKVTKHLQLDGIFGPNDLNVYQALAVMGRSSRLFTANSTLSWWGGFLAEGQGGKVVIPNPFFRNIQPAPGSAFHFPNFGTLPSCFFT